MYHPHQRKNSGYIFLVGLLLIATLLFALPAFAANDDPQPSELLTQAATFRGAASTTQNPSHTYSSIGTYIATPAVSDAGGHIATALKAVPYRVVRSRSHSRHQTIFKPQSMIILRAPPLYFSLAYTVR